IGLDAGSVAVKLVVLDEKGTKLEGHYVRHYGHPVREAIRLVRDLSERYPGSSLSITGSSGKMMANALGIRHTNEVVSQSYATKRLFPHIKTIIERGGEDSKLILLEEGRIKDFSMNSVCAAGTGSFLEQQAERLRLTIEEFSDMADLSPRPAKIAGRCSVFAKSDMIHLQQIATPVEDIVAGLCFAVARNFKGAIVKGRDILSPVAFQGGVAANKGMVRAFREVFGLDALIVPPDFALMGAMGAAMRDMDDKRIQTFDIAGLDSILHALRSSEQGHRPLITEGDGFITRHVSGNGNGHQELFSSHGEKAYLGIDIGSISTNLAVIDTAGNLLAKRYLMTAGRPIEAVRQGLREVSGELGDSVVICGVGTTGSGRYMIADYVGADIVKNEITAQATAAIYIDPRVDTILEIGGQDSKYISIRDGIIVDFEMNKACAAGTGSFIEEQAEKLDISVKGEFAECAFQAQSPCRLGERCTVFMENSLMTNLQRGMEKEDLLAGLAYSIVQNYVNRVVAGKPIGERVFFQGGVAFNKSVVAAFEKYLEKEIIVPPNHDVTGAIGMALIAREHMEGQRTEDRSQKTEHPPVSPLVKGGIEKKRTKFKGFELSQRPYEISSFECKGCENVCEINRVKVQGEEGNLFYGGRCEKYDVRKARNRSIPDLFSFREEQLWRAHNENREKHVSAGGTAERGRIGLPYIFFFHDYLPYWTTLLWELGFEVVTSPKTNKQVANLGVENVLSEACFPIKVAHGHIAWLRDAGVDAIFIPSFINTNYNGDEYKRGLGCPHTQTIPYVSRIAIKGVRGITPKVDFELGPEAMKSALLLSLKDFGINDRDIEAAMVQANTEQVRFQNCLRKKGKEILDSIEEASSPAVVIIGRAYNSFDSGMNLEIPEKLSRIDCLSIPMDFLPLSSERIENDWPNMYWRSGQRILKAARIVRRTPNLYPIYIGSFSCGPDSFILKYFHEEMLGKPFLHLEIDEHSADAGAVTRCEAFLDSIEQQNGKEGFRVQGQGAREEAAVPGPRTPDPGPFKKRKVFIPHMADHVHALQAAFEYCGVPAEVLPESDRDSVDL
ncbi:MAG: CoA protein activase, partial [Nitrospirales bacterium]|nr:CoA protein activase [Nitrospirales bacterium]